MSTRTGSLADAKAGKYFIQYIVGAYFAGNASKRMDGILYILNDGVERISAAPGFKCISYGFKRGSYRFFLPLRTERDISVRHRQRGIRRYQIDNGIDQSIDTGARF